MKPKKGKPKEKEVKDKAAEKPKEKPEADDKPKGEWEICCKGELILLLL